MLSVTEAHKIASIPRRTIIHAINKGCLKADRLGTGAWIIDPNDFEEWVQRARPNRKRQFEHLSTPQRNAIRKAVHEDGDVNRQARKYGVKRDTIARLLRESATRANVEAC